NWIITEILSYLNKNNVSINEQSLTPKGLARMLELLEEGLISSKHLKKIFEIVNKENHDDIDKIVKENNMMMISDPAQVNEFIEQVIENNPKSIEDYKAGKDNAIKFLQGQIMKVSQGQVNPKLASDLLIEKLKNL
ncbi:MAG: Asp-tRNA(Asn)/Glu-tRNA(Gln) amidotransferase GatCAB subunit B, partial [Erysipelotrichales bacterium]